MDMKNKYWNLLLIICLCSSFFILGRQTGEKNANETLDTAIHAFELYQHSQSNTLKCIEILNSR
ncbi:MAG: hypothetical protein CL666_08745 [Balneola sp.]|nr:hypothetical protein [Balneola sp.]